MKFEIKNIGLIDDATIELSNITCVCGLNNTGKTYVTYAIYGFLSVLPQLGHSVITRRIMQAKTKDGMLDLDDIFIGGIERLFNEMSELYTEEYLSDVFGTKHLIKPDSKFNASMPDQDIDYLSCEMQRLVTPTSKTKLGSINILKNPGSKYIEFISDIEMTDKFEIRRFSPFIVNFLHREVLSKIIPNVFVASAERTGAAIFRDELDFAKLRLFDILKNKQDKDISDALMNEAFGGNYSYAWPIEHNVDFVRKIETIHKESGYFCEKHPEIISDFESIIGGSYKVIKNVLVYQSNSNGKQKFAMSEASSSVRALLDIGFYIRCKLAPGDILMIDEPELNLHPRNQRMLARLLAKLVNYGVKVFLTTHSDFIIKEMNILIMLKNSKNAEEVAKKYNYGKNETISHDQISIYVTSKEKLSRKWINTLTKANITKEFGVSLPTFDNSIEEMVEIQSELFSGE